MPTCDDVKRALAGLATGEKPTPEMREHLASCDACRAASTEDCNVRLTNDWIGSQDEK